MDFITLLFIAFALALDAFAVSLSTGAYLVKADARQTFRMAFHFGLFQFLMPIIGWLAGSTFASLIESVDHWIAFGLLGIIGGHMIWNAFSNEDDVIRKDMTKGWALMSLSVATSIDALAVGLSLSCINVQIIGPAVLIGVIAGLMSLLGIRLGERVSHAFGTHMEYIGGIILVLIGSRILLEHLRII